MIHSPSLKQSPIKIHNAHLSTAFRQVDRTQFLDTSLRPHAHINTALPIGYEQTTSQPVVIIRMLELLIAHQIPNTVLEVGAGCGYQTAILAHLCQRVIALERIYKLAQATSTRLQAMGYNNVHVIHEDGFNGYPQAAPYDGIIVCAEYHTIPTMLVQQLSANGILVMPMTVGAKCRVVAIDANEKIVSRRDLVQFVPMLKGKK